MIDEPRRDYSSCSTWARRLLVAGLIVVHFLLAIGSARLKSPTSDEYTYISTGYVYLTTWDFRLDRTQPPLIRLFIGLPLAFYRPWMPPLHEEKWDSPESYELGYRLGFDMFLFGQNRWQTVLLLARLPIMLLSCALALLVYLWARDLYGEAGGIASLFLYCFCPNMLAHGRLATMDLGLCFFFVAALYAFYFYGKNQTRRRLALTGILLGLALAAKATALLLLPLMLCLLAWPSIKNHNHQWRKIAADYAQNAALLLLCAFAALLLLYGYPFRPFYFWDTISNVFYKSLHTGQASQAIPGMPHLNHAFYLFGHYSTHGWPYYYLAAMLVKTPTAIFIALLLVLVWGRRKWLGWPDAVIVSAFFLIHFAAAFNRVNIGLRHILPIYPILYIYLGRIVEIKPKVLRTSGLAALAFWYFWANISIYPDYLAYFNEICGGPDRGQYCLDDSNIDWGQDLSRLSEIQQQYPGQPFYIAVNWIFDSKSFGVDAQRLQLEQIPTPPTGIVAVGKHWAIRQRVQKRSPYYFDWLEKYRPIGQVGHSILLYRFEKEKI